MKIFYDKEVDAAYIRLSKQKPSGVIEIAEGINVDMTDAGQIVGIRDTRRFEKVSIRVFICL